MCETTDRNRIVKALDRYRGKGPVTTSEAAPVALDDAA